MIYSGDTALAMPTKDIYDTGIMQLVIGSAQQQAEAYAKREQEYNKQVGDFYSPFADDTKYWYDHTLGRVQKVADWLTTHNIPLDSIEARSILSRAISSTPTSQLAQLKQSAQTAKEYQKNYAVLAASGKLDPDAERWFVQHELGSGHDFQHWNTIKDGVWTRTSPYPKKDMTDLVAPYTKDITAMYDPEYSKNHDGGINDYYTISPERVIGPLQQNLDAIKQTPYGQYYYSQILQRHNGDTTAADKDFLSILAASSGKLGPGNTAGIYKMDMNENAKMDKQHQIHEQEANNELGRQETLIRYRAAFGGYDGGSGGGSGSTENEKSDLFDDINSSTTNTLITFDPNADNGIAINGMSKETTSKTTNENGGTKIVGGRPNVYLPSAGGTSIYMNGNQLASARQGNKQPVYTKINNGKENGIALTGTAVKIKTTRGAYVFLFQATDGNWYRGERQHGAKKNKK